MAEQPPARSFLRCRGSGMWRKASSEMGRTEPREQAEGKALQREGCERPVLCAKSFERRPNKWENCACISVCL